MHDARPRWAICKRGRSPCATPRRAALSRDGLHLLRRTAAACTAPLLPACRPAHACLYCSLCLPALSPALLGRGRSGGAGPNPAREEPARAPPRPRNAGAQGITCATRMASYTGPVRSSRRRARPPARWQPRLHFSSSPCVRGEVVARTRTGSCAHTFNHRKIEQTVRTGSPECCCVRMRSAAALERGSSRSPAARTPVFDHSRRIPSGHAFRRSLADLWLFPGRAAQ